MLPVADRAKAISFPILDRAWSKMNVTVIVLAPVDCRRIDDSCQFIGKDCRGWGVVLPITQCPLLVGAGKGVGVDEEELGHGLGWGAEDACYSR